MATSTLEREVIAASEPAPSDGSQAGRWRNDHSVNIRVSVPLPFGRWYVSLVAGPERRRVERRREDRREHPLLTSANMAFVLLVGVVLGGGFWLTVQSLLLWILSRINA